MAARKGAWAEDAACGYLQQHGAVILQRNWKCGAYEVDIIAQVDELIVFVEVKQREMCYFGRPSEAVNAGKVQRLTVAAEQYLVLFAPEANGRIDIIEVFGSEQQHRLNWIADALQN